MKKLLGCQKKRPLNVLFFCGITYKDSAQLSLIYRFLIQEYGSIFDQSENIDFSALTSFYQSEMGGGLKKHIISFKDLRPIENLHWEKIKTIEFELKHSLDQKREFNLDVGYLTLSKVVLFSSKDFAHRIYINNGIFAETTLFFSKKNQSFECYDYTYKDFRLNEFLLFLKTQRSFYKKIMITTE